mmetsp:Transcript_23727/g.35627  ORF Transcript_23727/g.35627 Transcript_23727/m.35627 type:complete len:278 (+) Transcript_23727:360-1193(+)
MSLLFLTTHSNVEFRGKSPFTKNKKITGASNGKLAKLAPPASTTKKTFLSSVMDNSINKKHDSFCKFNKCFFIKVFFGRLLLLLLLFIKVYCNNLGLVMASGLPNRTTSSPAAAHPATRLSTAILESLQAKILQPLSSAKLVSHQCRMIRNATAVLPVPGGPWMRETRRRTAANIAACWEVFRPVVTSSSGVVVDTISLHSLGTPLMTSSSSPPTNILENTLPWMLLLTSSMSSTASTSTASHILHTAAICRVRAILLANLSTRNLPDAFSSRGRIS